MKFRKDVVANPEPDATREEVRAMAEALSLYRSAMHHLGDREIARRPALQDRAEPGPARLIRLRLLLAPALGAAVAAGVLVPVYAHFHQTHSSRAGTDATRPGPAETRAAVDDAALMNQIDTELSEDVPDALRPLADLSDQTTTNSASEKKNVTQE